MWWVSVLARSVVGRSGEGHLHLYKILELRQLEVLYSVVAELAQVYDELRDVFWIFVRLEELKLLHICEFKRLFFKRV